MLKWIAIGAAVVLVGQKLLPGVFGGAPASSNPWSPEPVMVGDQPVYLQPASLASVSPAAVGSTTAASA